MKSCKEFDSVNKTFFFWHFSRDCVSLIMPLISLQTEKNACEYVESDTRD